MSSGVAREAILDALKDVQDPEVQRSIVEMDMVKSIEIKGTTVHVEVLLTIRGCPLRTVIEDQVREAVLRVEGVTDVNVVIGTMSDEERQRFAAKLKGPDATAQQTPDLLKPDTLTEFVAIASGKGGVGKSTVTANLAVALGRLGYRVGVIDADIYGFSLPNLFGVADVKPAVVENVVMPVQVKGIKLVSMQFFVPDNRPIIWRGPMLGKMLRNFFQEVHWGTLDVVLLDLPPGTGDMALDVHNMFPRSKELIVTTPQQTAADVAIRAGLMALHTKHEILGVIENMAFYQCKGCGERTYLFGQGGGAQVADGLQTSVLAQIPMGEPMEGTQGIFARDSLQGQAFDLLAQQVASDLRLEALAAARE